MPMGGGMVANSPMIDIRIRAAHGKLRTAPFLPFLPFLPSQALARPDNGRMESSSNGRDIGQ